MKKNLLWMAVSPDLIELPIAVEDIAVKLAERMGTTRTNIVSKNARRHNGNRCGYKVVTVVNE